MTPPWGVTPPPAITFTDACYQLTMRAAVRLAFVTSRPTPMAQTPPPVSRRHRGVLLLAVRAGLEDSPPVLSRKAS